MHCASLLWYELYSQCACIFFLSIDNRIAYQVSSSVAASMSSATAGFAGVDDQASATVEVLISNVQFLNLYASIGGSEAPEQLSGFRWFAKSMGWSNFNFGFEAWLRQSSSRRSQFNGNVRSCEFESVVSPVGRIVAGAQVFCGVSMLRVMTCMVMHGTSKKIHNNLKFPAWEGPLFLCGYLGLCISLAQMMSRPCPMWLSISAVIFALLPALFLAVSLVCVRRHLRKKNLLYLRYHPPNHAISKKRAELFPKIGASMFAYLFLFVRMKQHGEWEFAPLGGSRFWSFSIQHYSGNVWSYTIWKLAKRIAFSFVLNFFDGRSNAMAAVAVQAMDTAIILVAGPHISRDAYVSESVGAVANLVTVLFLSFPFFGLKFISERIFLYLSLVATTFSALIVIFPIIQQVVKRLRKPAVLLQDLAIVRGLHRMLTPLS